MRTPHPPRLVVYRFDTPVFFANADVFRDHLRVEDAVAAFSRRRE